MNRPNVYAFLLDRTELTSAYATPLLAAMMRPVHAFDPTRRIDAIMLPAWLDVRGDGLRIPTVLVDAPRLADLPSVERDARIAWGILCARSFYLRPEFLVWSDDWLAGKARHPSAAFALINRLPRPRDDRAYVAHWALMAAAFPNAPTLAAQTAALVASLVCPQGTFDYQSRAELALTMV